MATSTPKAGAGIRLSLADLKKIMPLARGKAGEHLDELNRALQEFAIDTPKRIAAFLAQVAVESGQLTRPVENLDYTARRLLQVFPSRFDPRQAADCAHQPEAIANRVYANRMGNGDEASGDGWRYRGRGLLHLTGKRGYRTIGAQLQEDLVAHPERVGTDIRLSVRTAACFFACNGCNTLADLGAFEKITRKINAAGMAGQVRRKFYESSLKILE